MPQSSLDPEMIASLLKSTEKPSKPAKVQQTAIVHQFQRPTRYPTFGPTDPIRRTDKETACVSRGCRAPTWHTFKGMPYCTIHLLHKANIEIIRLSCFIPEQEGML